jgi:hypothetical protein
MNLSSPDACSGTAATMGAARGKSMPSTRNETLPHHASWTSATPAPVLRRIVPADAGGG